MKLYKKKDYKIEDIYKKVINYEDESVAGRIKLRR